MRGFKTPEGFTNWNGAAYDDTEFTFIQLI